MLFLLITLLFGCSLSAPYACAGNYSCNPAVSDQYLYSYCAQGQCQCRKDLGFFGDATNTSRCECKSPLFAYWLNSLPYCINYTEAVSARATSNLIQNAKAVTTNVYLGIRYPQCVYIIYDLMLGNPNPYFDLFTNDTVGRISPVGVFAGIKVLVEYYIAAGYLGTSQVPTIYFNSLFSQDGSSTFVNADLPFNQYDQAITHILYSYNLTHEGEDKMRIVNGKTQIYSGDKDILNLDAAVASTGVLNFSDPQLHGYICTLLPQFGCNANTDPLGNYANFSDCMTSLGAMDGGSLGNTLFHGRSVACVYLHFVFVPTDPITHCPHTGKTGGGHCIDRPYITYYLHKYKKRSLRGKKRYEEMSEEVLMAEFNTLVNEVLFENRLHLLKIGVPESHPLITVPLNQFLAEKKEEHTRKISPQELSQGIDALKGNNFLEWDSIIMRQKDALIKAGVSPNHPMLRDTKKRMASRKRSELQYIIDFPNTNWELAKQRLATHSTIPPAPTH